jgi:signal transduction histidine kinase
LTPVLTTVQSLEAEADLYPALRGSIEMIRRNVELEARLIDDLLDLTRIAKNKLELNLQTIDAHEALSNAMEICGEDIRAKRLTLEIDLAATRYHVKADSARLHQIFWNLIKNAVKFTPEGGRVSVRTANAGASGRVRGSYERVQGSSGKVQASGFGVQDSSGRVQGSEVRVQGSSGRVQDSEGRVQELEDGNQEPGDGRVSAAASALNPEPRTPNPNDAVPSPRHPITP